MRAFYAWQGLAMHLESGGRMRLTRVATPANLRAIATEYTGKVYPRSTKGLTAARDDLKALLDAKDLDQMGETRAVNREVGGVAADL